MNLKQQLAERKITKAQYKIAQNGYNPRLSAVDGSLWITIDKKRLLITRSGATAFDGKQLTGK